MATQKAVIGYYNPNQYPVSFTGPNNAPISLPEGKPLLNGGTLVPPNRLCDHLVSEGILRAVLEDDDKFSRFLPSRSRVRTAASASLLTAEDANGMDASKVKVTRRQAPTSKLVPEVSVDSRGVSVTMPSGASVHADGKIAFNNMTFANEVSFRAYLRSTAGTDDHSTREGSRD